MVLALQVLGNARNILTSLVRAVDICMVSRTVVTVSMPTMFCVFVIEL
jgi:hypothetical protein